LPFLLAVGIPDYLRNIANYQDRFFPFLSVEAWNFWGLIQERVAGGHFVLDSQAVLGPLTPRLIGLLMTFGAEALIALAIVRRPTKDRLLLGLAAASLVSFNLMTTMHERYSYAALVFLAPLLARPAVFLAWSILAVTISLNILAAAPPNQQAGSVVPVFGPTGAIGSVAMVAATSLVVVLLLRAEPGEPDRARRATSAPPGQRRHLLGRRRPVSGPDRVPAAA
jgi:hypothetical protein